MSLHILKLCVGVSDISELAEWQAMRKRTVGKIWHTTRMIPKRADEIVEGGSIYWVIKGMIAVRQRITAIEQFEDDEGISRCNLVMDDELVPVRPVSRRPFQGWRYLKGEDAPKDIAKGSIDQEMPEKMRNELADLGLL
ncbi:MAG: DUF1489 domain-containing protein [Anderseniella sp.]